MTQWALVEDSEAAQVAAAQFAGGMAIAAIAEHWDRDAVWVEEAIRHALLESIPRRDGGLKASRTEMRAERHGVQQTGAVQSEIEW